MKEFLNQKMKLISVFIIHSIHNFNIFLKFYDIHDFVTNTNTYILANQHFFTFQKEQVKYGQEIANVCPRRTNSKPNRETKI